MPSISDPKDGPTTAAATDVFQDFPQLSSALSCLDKETAEVSAFLQPNQSIASSARSAAKALYAYATQQTAASTVVSAPPRSLLAELHVDGFDAEQIWLQLEMQTEALLRRAQRQLKKLGDDVTLVPPEVERDIDELLNDANGEQQEGATEEQEQSSGSSGSDADEEAFSGDDGGVTPSTSKRKRTVAAAANGKSRSGSKRPVEDEFLDLDDMEEFVRDAELAEGRDDEDDEDEDEDEDGEGPGFSGGEGEDDEEDAGLEALLARSAQLVGKKLKQGKPGQRKKQRRGSDDDDDGLGAAAELRYEDLWGSRRGRENGDDDMEGEGEGRSRKQRHGREDGDGGEDDEPGLQEEEDDHQSDSGMQDGDEDEDMEGEGADGEQADGLPQSLGQKATGAGAAKGSKEDKAALAGLSAHERRLLRLQENLQSLEAAAMGEKDWHMRGEADASRRPLNSALEVYMDFESTQRPAPQPTEESTADVEDVIRKRIAEGRFDDPIRIVAPPPEKKKVALELDDTKSKKGLGEIYEQQYVKTVMGVSEDKDDKVRAEARALFAEVCAKLDALTHFHFAPKPVVHELEVRSDVAAVAMEEVAPLVVSAEAMRRPDEVYKPTADGKPRAEGEMSREERKRRRAEKKRVGKTQKAAKDQKRKVQAVTEGGEAQLAGRRSEAGEKAAAKAAKKAAKESRKGGKSEFSKSTMVFKKLQEQKEQAAAGIKPKAKKDEKASAAASASALKL